MTVQPFLLFTGNADEAMNFYVSVFPGVKILEIVRYGEGGPGTPGSVMRAAFTVGGQTILCTDSVVKHDFTFTPATSFFVNCDSEEEIQRVAAALLDGGQAFMPLRNYGFSRQFAWISDRYGVSWQLNLA